MNKKVAILQSNYIPWKGYFDLINSVDVFVIYDEVQYTKNDWRNRNLIKTKNGLEWLTIPVAQKNFSQKINETVVSQNNWNKKHWSTINGNYAKAPFFKAVKDDIEHLYLSQSSNLLTEINLSFINFVCKFLGIETKIIRSEELNLKGDRNERLIDACTKLDATTYLSGPAAKSYLDTELFAASGLDVLWTDYSGYSDYPQLFPPFEHGVSILDMIFNLGDNTTAYMKSFSKAKVD